MKEIKNKIIQILEIKSMSNIEKAEDILKVLFFRKCKQCGIMFDFKHWNKQFCSDACRILHWENATGIKLRLKKANQLIIK